MCWPLDCFFLIHVVVPILSLWSYSVNSFIYFLCLSSDEYYLLLLLLCLTNMFLLLWMLVTFGISQAVGSAEGMPVIDGREWSDGKLVISAHWEKKHDSVASGQEWFMSEDENWNLNITASSLDMNHSCPERTH